MGPVDAESAQPPSVPGPPIVLEHVLANFTSILARLKTVWLPVAYEPIKIPDKPDKRYYQDFAYSFAKSYFSKNLLKCLLSLELLRYHIRGRRFFYDLGGGSGAFSIALLTSNVADDVEIVDYSQNQLSLAEKVAHELGYDQNIILRNCNIEEFSASDNACVASYAFCEAMQHDVAILQKIEESSMFILVDSPAIVKGAQSYLNFRGIKTFGRRVEFTVGDELRPFVEGGGGTFSFLFKGPMREKAY